MKAITAITLIFLLLCLSGCETFRGFGRDMQRAGKNIEKVSHK